MMNLRECAKKAMERDANRIRDVDDYAAINREERNLCAVLFHLLLVNDNMRRFMELLTRPFGATGDNVSMYSEYAYARDLWNAMGRDTNKDKQDFVLEKLDLKDSLRFRAMDPEEFNTAFGATPKASKTDIQNPGRWTVKTLNKTLKENDEFRRACVFKWAFNSKPDLVIHVSPNEAICIEAKLESAEGNYPQASDEKRIFTERLLKEGSQESLFVRQTEVQRYLMEQILGIKARHVFLRRPGHRSQNTADSSSDCQITWHDVFSTLDQNGVPSFLNTVVQSVMKAD